MVVETEGAVGFTRGRNLEKIGLAMADTSVWPASRMKRASSSREGRAADRGVSDGGCSKRSVLGRRRVGGLAIESQYGD